MVIEHGAAALDGYIQDLLKAASGGLITCSESGMQGAAAHAGQYDGIRRGNPRHKASLESSNNLTHNAFADLPGQTGKDRNRQPEQLAAMVRETEALLATHSYLSPESQALLQMPLLTSSEFWAIACEKYQWIESSRNHDLNDWDACGFTTVEMLLGNHWIDRKQLLLMPPDEAQMALAMISGGSIQTRPQKLSRAEAWAQSSNGLIRLPGFGVWGMLSKDSAKPHTVAKQQFSFEDEELGPGKHRFADIIRTPEGRIAMLKDGETYSVLVNPFAPEVAFIGDSQNRYLGEAKRIVGPDHADLDATHRAMGEASKSLKDALEPFRLRHMADARQRTDRARHNAAVLSGFESVEDAKATAARIRAEKSDLSDFMPEPRSHATPAITTEDTSEEMTLADFLPTQP